MSFADAFIDFPLVVVRLLPTVGAVLALVVQRIVAGHNFQQTGKVMTLRVDWA